MYFRSVCCLLAVTLIGFTTAATTEERCKELESAEDLDDRSKFSRNGAFLIRDSINLTSIGIRWSLKEEDAADVCSFTVHVWKAAAPDLAKALLTSNSHNASTRLWLIEELEPGTKYEIIVETIYATNHQAVSWTLKTPTLGFGPDNPCNCNVAGTLKDSLNMCDVQTGQCACKDINTLGRQCDSCPTGFYMHEIYGCALCDQCPPAKFGGNGSCVYDVEHLMQCSCLEGYTGTHCKECIGGYQASYITEPKRGLDPPIQYTTCIKCDCTVNNDTVTRSCFEKTGDCKACLFKATGPVCDSCVEKFGGSALNETCIGGVGTLAAAPNSLVIIVFIVIILLCLAVVVFVIYRRYLRSQRTRRYFDSQMKPDDDNVKFSAMMEEPEIDFYRTRKLSSN